MSVTASRCTRSRHFSRLVAGAVLAMSIAGAASAAMAAWPERPIKLVVPFGPGGPVDVIARLLSGPLGEALGGASVVVENRAGASGNVGVGVVARAEPDGYTVLTTSNLTTSNTFVINPMIFSNPGYDPEKDFQPLVDMAGSPTVFVVDPKLGVSTLAEFIALAKRDPGKVNFAAAGFGTPSHLAGEFLKIRAGIAMPYVPTTGAAPTLQALLSGSIQFVSFALPGMHPQIKAGNVRALAVASEKRWHDLAEIPTMIEAGFPGFVLDTYTIMMVPARTPPEIGQRLAKETIAILQRPELQARLRTIGFEATAAGPDALKARFARELPIWRNVVKQAGIKPQEAK